MKVWIEEAPAPAAPGSAWRRFWRALGQFLYDYNRY
jgi:hypothetical protein